jgi:hypothetical protein
VKDNALDHNEDPLFPDLSNEIYLSPNYLWSYEIDSLKRLGIKFFSTPQLLDRVEADLQNDNSRMKTKATNDDWHTYAADLLLKPLLNQTQSMERVKKLPLIPLQDGNWASASRTAIYFPNTIDVPIPTDLTLSLVDPNTLENDSRRKLFDCIGVTHCEPERVVSLILDKHKRKDFVSLESSVAHLRYLYWNLPSYERSFSENISLYNQKYEGGLLKQRYYFQSDKEYGAQELLKRIDEDHYHAPGHAVDFLHSAYVHAVPTEACRIGWSWMSWLEEFFEVQHIPQVVPQYNPTTLSFEFVYIVDHRPDKLMGLLKECWGSYEPLIGPKVRSQLSQIHVLSESGQRIMMRDSYLPLPHLKTKIEELGVVDFPFLQMPECLSEEAQSDWAFLRRFGVGIGKDIRFHVSILESLSNANCTEFTTETTESLFKVYRAIDLECCSQKDKDQVQFVPPLVP